MDERLIIELERIVGAQNVLRDEPMSAHTTFRIGGPADAYLMPHTVDEVARIVRACATAEVPLRFIGAGSNLLVADAGLCGVTVQLLDNLSSISVEPDGLVRVQAGATNQQVSDAACQAGLAGYEFASGVPGTIGGAAIMNAGAYDGQFADVALSCTCLTPTGDMLNVTADQAAWSYRHSMMMDEGLIVLGAVLQLHADDPAAIRARIDDLTARREAKQPLDLPSAGSTFKRPEGYFAGALIQQAGMQGHTCGGAQVSTKHAGFVVNAGNATAADVLAVIRDVQQAVWDHAGVMLEPEVRMWGFD